ncbi:DUF134 domain-containing protein [Cetobacterium sp. ZOR0034]|uniref:DUF134 domain-containing protein n=1 Tax=Cetobacterium sp. ZOR0034 TaxID=1339239 RepID=UPI00064630CF|nr:DUF134 domain-containing protein [Cetobacterium sp. ZOR0034]
MARPTKVRSVEFIPTETKFIPEGSSNCNIHFNEIKIEELEALRLKDLENLSQEECAEKMEVSRQTFQNILNSARIKVAEALIMGYGIELRGGDFKTPHCQFICNSCGQTFIPTLKKDLEACPSCNSENIFCTKKKIKCKKVCKLNIKD